MGTPAKPVTGLKPQIGPTCRRKSILPFSNKMGKLNIFEIALTNPVGVYFAGQNLEGTVIVELNDEMKMRGIRLQFLGKAYVHWTETHRTGSGKNRRTETRHYSASEQYFNFEMLLFGPGSGSTMLAAGRHTFPFVFTLPMNLPSSYESYIGNVRYSLKGTIDKPWKFDHKTKKMFTVMSVLDLNQQPAALTPGQGQNSKNLCCLCCKSGPISALFRIDRAGYVPGDSVYINAEITNLSTRRMNCSRVRLIMSTVYHATSKSRTVTKEVDCVTHPEIGPGGTDVWSGDRMIIPPLPPSYLVGCRIIDIKYILQLEVDPSGPAFDLEVPLEIIIGTIPLQNVVQQFYPQAMPPQLPPPPQMAPPPQMPAPPPMMPSAPTAAPPPSNMPPPSYEECVFGKATVVEEDDGEHTRGDRDFAPVYTYYDWSKSVYK